MSYPTVAGRGVEGLLYREAQVCLGPKFANSYYLFFLSGTSTPTNVYQDGALTTTFPLVGRVTSDSFGRFPAIYLDPSVVYRVQFFNNQSAQQWQLDPYVSQLSTVGTSSLSAFGFQIAVTGEATMPAPNSGGSGITLTAKAGTVGSAAIRLNGTLPGNSAIIVNSSATTGAQTATFVATNKPGTSASAPAGWLPITCDGVQYYTPLWFDNSNFTPYTANPSAVGEVINAASVTFGGNGLTSVVAGTATPGNWFSPVANNIGASYWVNITKTGGLSGLAFVEGNNNGTIATAAPSGATYTGGTLTSNFTGNTASNYTLQLSTGQLILGCTFTNGSPTFTTPSTNITGTPNTVLYALVQGVWVNITGGGVTISGNAHAPVTGTYQISSSSSGTPVVASGTITMANDNGVQNITVSGSTPFIMNGDGTATLNGAGIQNWFFPTTANIGSKFYISVSQTGSTNAGAFTGLSGVTNVTNTGLTIGVTGTAGTVYNASGTYSISSDVAGLVVLGTGTISLTGGSGVQSNNYSGAVQFGFANDGTTSYAFGVTAGPNWYVPTTTGVGAGFWVNITRTGGSSGVNFTAAQGSWTNISGAGLGINISGYSGVYVGTANASGTYQISSSSSGTPVLGSGTVNLTVSGLTVTHTYTSGSGTETVPPGSSFLTVTVNGAGGGGSGGSGATGGGGGGGGGQAVSTSIAVTGGQTLNYSVPAGGAGSVTAGGSPAAATVTGNGPLSAVSLSAGSGAGATGPNLGVGGTATGGNSSNTSGTNGGQGGFSIHTGPLNGPGGASASGAAGGTIPAGVGASPGGGGGGTSSGNVGGAGAPGSISFTYS